MRTDVPSERPAVKRLKDSLRVETPHHVIATHIRREIKVMGGMWPGNVDRLSREIAEELGLLKGDE